METLADPILSQIYVQADAALALGPYPILSASDIETKPKNEVTAALAGTLYAQCFVRRFDGTLQLSSDPGAYCSLEEELRRASAVPERLDTGWTVEGWEPNGFARLSRCGTRQVVYSWLVRPEGEFGHYGYAPTKQFSIIREAYSLTTSPGFFMVQGGPAQDSQQTASMTRVYWNVSPEQAAPLVRTITSSFEDAAIPFQFKTLLNRADYWRLDSAVLYTAGHHSDAVGYLLNRILHDRPVEFGEAMPAFTCPLGPGVAWAEDPMNGESFGQSRCRLVAEAILACYPAGVNRMDKKREALAQAFTRAGLSLDRPHLGRGSKQSLVIEGV